jgi:hypothetical protein
MPHEILCELSARRNEGIADMTDNIYAIFAHLEQQVWLVPLRDRPWIQPVGEK